MFHWLPKPFLRVVTTLILFNISSRPVVALKLLSRDLFTFLNHPSNLLNTSYSRSLPRLHLELFLFKLTVSFWIGIFRNLHACHKFDLVQHFIETHRKISAIILQSGTGRTESSHLSTKWAQLVFVKLRRGCKKHCTNLYPFETCLKQGLICEPPLHPFETFNVMRKCVRNAASSL